MTGQNLSHYQIFDKLGDGGMGEVYKARDTHLDRFVAIKVLRPDRVGDADRRLRFVQEAKAASALNHPNIVTIYDIDIACGVHFIAMEYVPGRTLDRVIGRKGLKLGEALHYAVQMADALAKAHAAGIVHRDVKPSNIMVTDDGVIKVLDFGLAKLTEEVGPDDETATVRTAEGTIVGTAAYMSPEQAEGKPLDARTDIFSFGTVLYEMLTGQRAFEGATRISTLAAILHAQPKAPGTVPGEVGRVLQRCLKKEPQRRFQTMSDLKVALEELKEESDSGTLAAVPGSRPRRRWPLAAAAVAITALAAWLWFPRSVDAPAELRLSKLTFDAGLTSDGTISPDGKLAAYASDRGGDGNLDIWVQHIAGRQPIRLTRHEADDQSPAFSPDGSRIVFQSQREGGGLYVVDVLGGEERKIADRGSYPRYSPDGAWISCIVVPAYPGLAKMYLVPAGGGPPKPFLPGHGTAAPPMSYGPVWSPDSRFLLFKGSDGKVADWWVAPVEGGAPVATGAERSFADLRIWAPNVWWHNYVVLNAGVTTEGVNLFRASFTGKWKLAGPAVPLTSGTGLLYGSPPSRDGRLPVTSLNWLPSHWSLPLKSNQAAASGEPHQLTREGVSKVSAAVSHDGSKLA